MEHMHCNSRFGNFTTWFVIFDVCNSCLKTNSKHYIWKHVHCTYPVPGCCYKFMIGTRAFYRQIYISAARINDVSECNRQLTCRIPYIYINMFASAEKMCWLNFEIDLEYIYFKINFKIQLAHFFCGCNFRCHWISIILYISTCRMSLNLGIINYRMSLYFKNDNARTIAQL